MRTLTAPSAGLLLMAAILAYGSGPADATPISGLNDTIATATGILRSAFGIGPTAEVGDDTLPRVRIESAIGVVADVDIYGVQLRAGETLTMDIDFAIALGLDTILTVYDGSGNLLTTDDDNLTALGGTGSVDVAPGITFDSFLTFTAATDATFFIGVSSFDIIDPVTGAGVDGSTGDYVLQLSITPIVGSAGFGTVPQTFSGSEIVSGDTVSLPEPATAALLGFALVALGTAGRRRQ